VKAGAIRGNGRAKAPRKGGRSPHKQPESRKAKSRTKASKTRVAPPPDFVPPSLATLLATAPKGPGWVHEIKFDGYRIQARLDRGQVRLLTRKGLDWCRKFPNVAAAVAELPATAALIDGEVVIEDENGISTFSGLQAALKASD